MNDDHDYDAWVRERRALSPPDDLASRIMSALDRQAEFTVMRPVTEHTAVGRRLVPILVCTAASLLFVARIVAMVGNLIFPTGYPEFAVEQQIEEVPHEHRSVSRS